MAAVTSNSLPLRNVWDRRTLREDLWWLEPLAIALALLVFLGYSAFRVLENDYFHAIEVGGTYLYHTPLASPDLLPFVPDFLTEGGLGYLFGLQALLILPFPSAFRFTCYYARRIYYRSFFGMPPACAVEGATTKWYRGERMLFVMQNLHRYFVYVALLLLALHVFDMLWAFGLITGTPHLGLGAIMIALDTAFLAMYLLGCHSLRHLFGGNVNCFTCDSSGRRSLRVWKGISLLNSRHGLWFWVSLTWLMLTDLYIRGVALGWFDFLGGLA